MKVNRVIQGDCLEVMRDFPSEYVDLIYLDPPFNTGKNWREFKDRWTGKLISTEPLLQVVSEVHSIAMANYLAYMGDRLKELKRVLRETGSIYLHCDSTASHYLKLLMDSIFGRDQYRNEIIWKRVAVKPASQKFGSVHDTILFYANKEYHFNPIYLPLSEAYIASHYNQSDQYGRFRSAPVNDPHGGYYYDLGYGEVTPEKGYRMPKNTALEMIANGELQLKEGKVPSKKLYLKDSKGVSVTDLFTDINVIQFHSSEASGYPTQKPLALLKRIILASSEEDDIVLDPFCGSGTSLVAAQELGRMYLGIDINPRAVEISRRRVK